MALRDAASDVVTYLAGAGLDLTSGTNLFIGQMPPEDDPNTPDAAVSVLQTGGASPEPYLGGMRRAVYAPSCQVRVRGPREDFEAGQARALAVMEALSLASIAPYFNVQIRESAPFYGGTDGVDRHLWSFNVELEYVYAP